MTMMSGRPSYRALVNDGSAKGQALPPGITRRIISYARPHWRTILFFLLVTALGAAIVVANPLLLKTNMASGHFGRSGRYEALRDLSEQYAFVLGCFGMASASV